MRHVKDIEAMAFKAVGVIILVAVVSSGSAVAQDPIAREPPLVLPMVAGAGLGMVGFIGGGIVGWNVDTSCDDAGGDFCLPLWGAFIGSAIGGTTGVVFGTHLGNRARGKLGQVYLASALTWAGGFSLAILSRNSRGASHVVLAVLPVVQFGITVWQERTTGRERERERGVRAQTYVAPTPGGLRGGVRVTWPSL